MIRQWCRDFRNSENFYGKNEWWKSVKGVECFLSICLAASIFQVMAYCWKERKKEKKTYICFFGFFFTIAMIKSIYLILTFSDCSAIQSLIYFAVICFILFFHYFKHSLNLNKLFLQGFKFHYHYPH